MWVQKKMNEDLKEADLPDHDTAHEIMEVAFEHYFMHTEAVLKRLGYAKDATNQSLEGLLKVKSYRGVWDEILGKFIEAGLSEDGLQRIELVLGNMPKMIDEIYTTLVEADRELASLEEELGSEKYRQALEQIEEIQSQPNQMSGLGPEEYDIDLFEDSIAGDAKANVQVEVYKFAKRKDLQ